MRWTFLCLLLTACLTVQGQRYFGFRFASDINYFPEMDRVELINSAFTTGKFGLYYASYQEASGFEIGFNLNYKDGNGQGFPNLPVVMEDWGENQNVSYFGLEMDFKAGPRIWPIYPKIGYVLGYRFTQLGFLQDPQDDIPVNPWYLMFPFGLSAKLPTQWGLVGFGGFFNVGVLNVLNLRGQPSFREGGRHRSFTLEMTVSIENR